MMENVLDNEDNVFVSCDYCQEIKTRISNVTPKQPKNCVYVETIISFYTRFVYNVYPCKFKLLSV